MVEPCQALPLEAAFAKALVEAKTGSTERTKPLTLQTRMSKNCTAHQYPGLVDYF
jgi:hypothetical protein